MSASTDDEKDVKLTALIKTMFERVPKEKRLSVDVVMQLLKVKYAAVFPAEYIDDRTGFIADLIDSLYSTNGAEKKDSGVSGDSKEKDGDGEDDDDDDDDEEDDDEESGEEEEEEEEDEEEDDEDSESDASDESGSDANNNDAECEPAMKRQRLEDGASEVTRRCHEMVECLRRLSYRVRKQTEEESPETYLQQYLVPFFQEKGFDPTRYSKEDVKRYRVQKELEQLKSDGADVNLDRSARAGRGLAHLAPTKDTTVNVKTSQFLDDE